jgi:deoxyribose-phosphate aldolase
VKARPHGTGEAGIALPADGLTRAALARRIDHSVLKPESTERDIAAGAAVVREWRIGFYCVQMSWVRHAAGLLAGTDATVISVIGFPHGCETASVKAHAAERAVADGAGEIDRVLDIGLLKSGRVALAGEGIAAVVRAVEGTPVKVIIEAAALTTDEKRLACRIAVDHGAAFVKTSTGFHPAGGATVDDIRLMRACIRPQIVVKASGGIRTLDDARRMLAAGASRIGASASAAILGALG